MSGLNMSMLVAGLLAFAASGAASAQADNSTPSAGGVQMQQCLDQAGNISADRAACIGTIINACPGIEGSTSDMVECIDRELTFWDARLNGAYKDLRAVYAEQDQDEPDGMQLADDLRDTQRAWIAWRDAKCSFAYREFRGGTIGRITGADCMNSMTAARAMELEEHIANARM
ncbi:lysozyme inhibitor LprI family protein [Henriciella marina]|uniref:lysozyme inhibitor LprI family protein n=1 Tax=Henriciella marina TaxID=453851 RepID=UPI000376160C|nr:lysozyme inhibitor LprI family protein [Henriciella marina]